MCYFSILADEATDISIDEISIHYLDEGSPKEVVMEFHKCVTEVTGDTVTVDMTYL